MSISSSIFKAYDIRGIVDDTLTEDAAYCVGRALGHKYCINQAYSQRTTIHVQR